MSRAGTHEQPGREFHMAKMAIDILGRDNIEVLVYGAGSSLDNHHIAKLRPVRHVAIGDIMKLRDDAEFIDANEPAARTFPVVVASEVVEHFRDPRDDFAKLFKFVAGDGLLVCGTNIYDGGNLSRDAYIHFADHTSYYTPQVLRSIANDAGFHIDFRTPLIADGHAQEVRLVQQVTTGHGECRLLLRGRAVRAVRDRAPSAAAGAEEPPSLAAAKAGAAAGEQLSRVALPDIGRCRGA